jgi:hypothetical protein
MLGGQGLVNGQSLHACDGVHHLDMQTDGNLVLYHDGYGALWSTGTQGTSGYAAKMQSDGNFVLYDHYSQALWNSGTQGHPGASLWVQPDGNLVIYPSGGGAALWNTGTQGR